MCHIAIGGCGFSYEVSSSYHETYSLEVIHHQRKLIYYSVTKVYPPVLLFQWLNFTTIRSTAKNFYLVAINLPYLDKDLLLLKLHKIIPYCHNFYPSCIKLYPTVIFLPYSCIKLYLTCIKCCVNKKNCVITITNCVILTLI